MPSPGSRLNLMQRAERLAGRPGTYVRAWMALAAQHRANYELQRVAHRAETPLISGVDGRPMT